MVNVVVGGSASGKTTLAKEFVKQGSDRVITNTTRPRGENEAEDAYHFLARLEFEAKIARGEMLEYAEYGGNLYGTSLDSITDNCVIVVEPNGLYALQKLLDKPMYSIYIKVAPDVRMDRAMSRGDSLIKFSLRVDGDAALFNDELEAAVDCVLDSPVLEDYPSLVKGFIDKNKLTEV